MNGLLLAAASLLPAAAAAAGVSWEPGFARDALWNDGNAEVSFYDAVDVRYGAPRTSRSVLIVVAEDLDRSRLVKADRPEAEPRTIRVLKFNYSRSVPAGVYTYQQMLSVFLAADGLAPVKLTVASHEWCGNTFVEWRSDRRVLALRSYFESSRDRDAPLSVGDALFYDALPVKLRSLDFARTRSGSLRVIDSLFSNRRRRPGCARPRSPRRARRGVGSASSSHGVPTRTSSNSSPGFPTASGAGSARTADA